jgi:hypothetical protein
MSYHTIYEFPMLPCTCGCLINVPSELAIQQLDEVISQFEKLRKETGATTSGRKMTRMRAAIDRLPNDGGVPCCG